MKALFMAFPHRQNWDGTHDSICPACFETVATTENEADLRAHERAHICDPLWAFRTSQGQGSAAPASSAGVTPKSLT